MTSLRPRIEGFPLSKCHIKHKNDSSSMSTNAARICRALWRQCCSHNDVITRSFPLNTRRCSSSKTKNSFLRGRHQQDIPLQRVGPPSPTGSGCTPLTFHYRSHSYVGATAQERSCLHRWPNLQQLYSRQSPLYQSIF